MKIAPTLCGAIHDPPWDPSRGPHEAACRELDALLAVARSAERHVYRVRAEVAGTTDRLEATEMALYRALARLDRVSRGPRIQGVPFDAVLARQMRDPEFAREFRKARAQRTRRRSR